MPSIQEKVILTEEEQQDLLRQVEQTGETKSKVLPAWMNQPPFMRGAEAGNKSNPDGRRGKKGAQKRRQRK